MTSGQAATCLQPRGHLDVSTLIDAPGVGAETAKRRKRMRHPFSRTFRVLAERVRESAFLEE